MSKCTWKDRTAQTIGQAMERHDGLVHAYIRRHGGGDISYEEALQAGRIGLWRAIQGYDPARGTAFSSYAWVAIWRHIHRRAKELNRDTNVEVRQRAFPPKAVPLEAVLIVILWQWLGSRKAPSSGLWAVWAARSVVQALWAAVGCPQGGTVHGPTFRIGFQGSPVLAG